MTDFENEDQPENSVDDAIARVGELARAAAETAAAPGTAVAPTGVGQAQLVKDQMVTQRGALLRQKQAVEAAAASAKAEVEKKVKAMEAELRAQLALLEPALAQLARLEDGVDALNIYLGRDEEIITVLEGERAPADHVITIRQSVLAMDEESLISADSFGMDFRDIDRFVEWLQRDPAHVEQLIPERKGITALIARRARSEHEDPWMQQAADQKNRETWWLVRNGECLWLTTTDFTVGNRTVPTPKEFTDMFIERGSFGRPDRPLEPGSAKWLKAEERADKRTRHYMKVALLLQGLLDRTTVLHPHDNPSFLDQAHYDSGRVQVILDDENALTDGRPSYSEWLRQKKADLHAGMRVIGAFAHRMRTYETRDSPCEVRPRGATPSNMVPYNIRATTRSWFEWEFSFDRNDEVWDENLRRYRAPKTKATGYLQQHDTWWLPLDTITEDEIAYYLGARSHRHEYLNMVPTLRAALAVKQAERQAEAPFRTALLDALARETSATDVDELADELIRWFKTGNQIHRALDVDDAKAARVILGEARRRARGESADTSRTQVLLTAHPEAVVIARRSNDLVVVVPQPRRHDAAAGDVYATLHIYSPAGTLMETREWVTLTRAQTSRWTVTHHTDAWTSWQLNPETSAHYTDDELDDVVARIRAKHPHTFRIAGSTGYRGQHLRVDFYEHTDGVIRHGHCSVYREKGQASVEFNWRTSEVSAGFDKAPHWQTRYSGHADPDKVLWQDEAQLAVATGQWNAAIAEAQARQVAQSEANRIGVLIERAWDARAEEQVRQRFIEDFGDPDLWEEHRKTVRVPQYPHRWNGDRVLRDALTPAFVADPELVLTGLTVAEIAARYGVSLEALPADILDIVPVAE